MGALIDLVNLFFYLLDLAIFARILLSWLPLLGIHVDPPIIRSSNFCTA
ncbi:MAG: hypothetical protein Q9O62_11240 [Ardenticatenia bacterium]|nr:hypothetical protein [Ardenticatenia bacterium]